MDSVDAVYFASTSPGTRSNRLASIMRSNGNPAGRAGAWPQLLDKALHIRVECSIVDEFRLPVAKLLQIGGELIRVGQRRAIKQNRHHGYIAGERLANLDPHKVARIFEPPLSS